MCNAHLICYTCTVCCSVGMVCAFLNNSNTTTAIDGIADTARSNLDDIKIFVNNTVDVRNLEVIYYYNAMF